MNAEERRLLRGPHEGRGEDLPRVVPDGFPHRLPSYPRLLSELRELRRLGYLQPHVQAEGDQQHAGQKRHPPAPGLEAGPGGGGQQLDGSTGIAHRVTDQAFVAGGYAGGCSAQVLPAGDAGRVRPLPTVTHRHPLNAMLSLAHAATALASKILFPATESSTWLSRSPRRERGSRDGSRHHQATATHCITPACPSPSSVNATVPVTGLLPGPPQCGTMTQQGTPQGRPTGSGCHARAVDPDASAAMAGPVVQPG